MQSIPLTIMGLTSVLMQITSMRQLVSVFSGNELDIGITLSVWLTSVGIGSYAGTRYRSKTAFALSFFAVALLSQATMIAANLIRPGLSVGFGETISLSATLLSTVVVLFPLCFVLGFQFPQAVVTYNNNASKVYGLEAAGAFAGGALFTLLLSGRTNAHALSLTVSIINIATALILLRKKSLLALLIIPAVLYAGADKLNRISVWKGAELVSKTESRYGELTVLKTGTQYNLYSSGKLLFSYPDPQTEEFKAHIPMTVHPAPDRILVIGGSPAILREMLKYPVSRLDFVEIDPEIINVSLKLLSVDDRNMLRDKRISMVRMDGRRFVKTSEASQYDLVVLNIPEPSTANINRLYTIEFFQEVKSTLKNSGVIFLSLPTSSGYIGKRMRMINGSIFNSLRVVFKNVTVSAEDYGIMLASDNFIETSPEALQQKLADRHIKTVYMQPSIIKDVFSPLKMEMVGKRLETVNDVNSDSRPAAYLYNLMLWSEAQGTTCLTSLPDYAGGLIIITIVLLVISITQLWRKKQAIYFSIFITGYSSISFSMIIILAYQAAYGYIYETIGLLTAVFMAGLACGAYGIRPREPLKALLISGLLMVLLLASSSFFFLKEGLFYLPGFLAGIIAGVEFSASNKLLNVGNSGTIYAFDLTGSFLGAFLASILFIPIFGIQNTVLFVVLIKISAIILLFSLRHKDSTNNVLAGTIP